MTLLEAIVLGIVQGLAEFLPISSSAHLIIIPWLFHWPDHGLAFDVALHLGTLAAVLLAFAGDWIRMVGSFFRGLAQGRPFAEHDARVLGLLALASVPGGLAGFFLDKWAETTLRAPLLIAAASVLLGALLFAADKQAIKARDLTRITVSDTLLIGTAQALALIPGVSRSGATITMALLLGFRREEAARFSFLLATPITAGAALLKVPHLVRAGGMDVLLPAMVAAAVFGILSIRVLLSYVRTASYRPFVWYRFAFAALILAVYVARSGQ